MKLLGIISLILAIVLFPPASLAVLSNNAVPGDSTYPIKRGLEDVIYAVASLNPTTKAWFAAARSDRRFQEFNTLIAQGKPSTNTLDELVAQADVTASEIKKIDDPLKKKELIDQYTKTIEKYDQGLQQVEQQVASKNLVPKEQPQTTSSQSPVIIEVTPMPSAVTTQQPTPSPAPVNVSSPKFTPKPSEEPKVSPTPTVTLQPSSPASSGNGSQDRNEIENARKKLKEIEDQLKKDREQLHQEKPKEESQKKNRDENSNKDGKSKKF